MPWLKLDDHFVEHRRIEKLSDKAFRLHVAALCQSARKLTDGHISTTDLRVLTALVRASKKHVSELQLAGVWEVNSDGYVIRDYLDYNLPADVIKERRKRDLERKKRMEDK